MGFPASCLVHFLFNEARPLLFFYIGWKGLVSGCGKFVEWDTLIVKNVPSEFYNRTVEEYNLCIAGDVASAAMSIQSPYVGKCVHMDWNPWGYLNFTCLAIILVFNLLMMYHIVALSWNTKDGKPLSYESGRFIRYLSYIQGKKWYRFVSGVFVLYTACAVAVVMGIGLQSLNWFDFLKTQAQGLILTIWGSYRFTQLHKPAFAMKNKHFKGLRFKRGMLGLFNQSNDSLCQKLEQALFSANWGDFEQLEGLIDFEKSDIKNDEKGRKALLTALNPDARKKEIKAAFSAAEDYQKMGKSLPK